jgi:AhpD family alkylhydroperoxidase
MNARLNYFETAPYAIKSMLALTVPKTTTLEPPLMELVKLRASQINGCAFCLDMHTREALEAGEKPQRLAVIAGWRDSPLYSERERAALAWTEKMTMLGGDHVSDGEYEEMAGHFSDTEQVDLMLLIVAINGWNRFNAGFGVPHPVES